MRLLCPAGNRQNPVMLQSIICSGNFLQRCEVHPCCWCQPAVPAAMQMLRSILRNNGLASSPQKECVQLLVSGSISVAMHQFLTTSSLGEPVLQDSCASCRVWLVLQECVLPRPQPHSAQCLARVDWPVIFLGCLTWPYLAPALGNGCTTCSLYASSALVAGQGSIAPVFISVSKSRQVQGSLSGPQPQAVMLVATGLYPGQAWSDMSPPLDLLCCCPCRGGWAQEAIQGGGRVGQEAL